VAASEVVDEKLALGTTTGEDLAMNAIAEARTKLLEPHMVIFFVNFLLIG
jgi:hypothetical protein